MRRLRERVSIPLLGTGLLLLLSSRSDGAIFPCTEAGFDQAIAAAEGGDPGPHGFACAPEDLPLVLTGTRGLGSSLTIDGEGQLVLQGLRVVPTSGLPDGSVLDLRNLTLIDPTVERLPLYALGLSLLGAHVSGTGNMRARNVAIHDSVISDYHPPVSALIVASSSGLQPPAASLEIVDSEVSGCSSSGTLVVAGGGAISIVSSAFWGNTAGDAIVDANATGTIEGTTISGNEAVTALWAGAGVTIENSTISGNMQPSPSSVLFASGLEGCPIVRNSTITGNTGISGHTYGDVVLSPPPSVITSCSAPEIDGTPAVFENTILDGSCRLFDLLGPPTLPISHGGNLETGGDTCGFTEATDQVAVAPAALALDVLADNGGPTETHALLPGSVARDAAVLASCPATDQRGEPRPEPGGSECDAGSFEALPEPGIAGVFACATLLWLLERRRRRGPDPRALYTSGNG